MVMAVVTIGGRSKETRTTETCRGCELPHGRFQGEGDLRRILATLFRTTVHRLQIRVVTDDVRVRLEVNPFVAMSTIT